MTIPCANCGEPLADDAYRCPICDALAPLPTAGDVDETEMLPWAIPIREGERPTPRSVDPMRPVLVAVLAIAVLAVLVVIGSQVLGGSSDEVAGQGEPEVEGDSVAADDTDTSDESDATGADTSTTTTTSSTTTTTTTSTTSTTTTTTTSTTAPPSAGSATMLSSSFRGGWVAQLTSVPTSAGGDVVESAWSRARSYASRAVVTRSDDWASLEPGYWVVVDAGPFASPDEVRDHCTSIGHADRSDCLPRELTGRR